MSTVTDTIITTIETLLPTIAATASPAAASAIALAPSIIDMLKIATSFANAGVMTPDQLATVFANAGRSIQRTHDAWNQMNAQVKQAA